MAQVKLDIIADNEQFKQKFKEVQDVYGGVSSTAKKTSEDQKLAFKTVEKAGESLKDQIKDLGKTLLGAFAVEKIIEFGKESLKAYAQAEQGINKLKFAITQVNGESLKSFEQLKESAEQLSRSLNTLFTPDQIIAAQTQLANFGLTTKQIQQLTPRILDLSRATGQDLSTATQKAILAINGQTKGLRDIGVAFADTGSKTDNFNLLLKDTEKFSGAAADSLNTTQGQIDSFGNKFEEFQESVGAFIKEGADTALTFLNYFANGFETAADADKRLNSQLKITKEQTEALNKSLNILAELNLDRLKKSGADGLALQKAQQQNEAALHAEFAEEIKKIDDKELQKRIDDQIAINKKFGIEKNATLISLEEELEARKAKIQDDATLSGEAKAEAARKKAIEDAENLAKELEKLRIERAEKEINSANLAIKQRDELEKDEIDNAKDVADKKAESEVLITDALIKQWKKRAEINEAEKEKQLKQQEDENQRKLVLAGQFGSLLGELAVANAKGNEELVQQTSKAILNLVIDTIEKTVLANIIGSNVTATATAIAQPDSVATFGLTGIARAAVLTGLITAAFEGFKALISGIGFHDGGHTGEGNEWDVAGVVHKEEFVSTKKTTKKHRNLLEALHTDDYSKLKLIDLKPMLEGTGVALNSDMPKEIYERGVAQSIYQEKKKNEELNELRAIKKELQDFKKTYKNKPSETTLPDGTRIIKSGNTTRKIRKR